MTSACALNYGEAMKGIQIVEMQGVHVPFVKPDMLLRMKQALSEKDKLDVIF